MLSNQEDEGIGIARPYHHHYGADQARDRESHMSRANPIIHTSDANFEREVLQSEKPVLVDFWAEWCGPCRMIGPIVKQVARERLGTLRVVKVNIDENPRIAQKLGIRSIPTLLVFQSGSIVAQRVGALRKAELSALIDRAV
jgi:thioredoxin 1